MQNWIKPLAACLVVFLYSAVTLHAQTAHTAPPVASAPAIAIDPPVHGLLAAALALEARSPRTRAAGTATTRQQPAATHGRWIGRHPVLFGTLVGAGAGTVAALTMENELFCSGGDEDCFFHGGSRALVGAGMGAGVGALVGVLAGLGRE